VLSGVVVGDDAFIYPSAIFHELRINPMLEATLAQLEALVAELLQQNQVLSETCRQL
jgi:hypothetical protein